MKITLPPRTAERLEIVLTAAADNFWSISDNAASTVDTVAREAGAASLNRTVSAELATASVGLAKRAAGHVQEARLLLTRPGVEDIKVGQASILMLDGIVEGTLNQLTSYGTALTPEHGTFATTAAASLDVLKGALGMG